MSRVHDEIYRQFLAELDTSAENKELATAFWAKQCMEIRKDAQGNSPHDFLRWPSLGAFSVPDAWIPSECYDELKSHPSWQQRWFHLTRETKVGAPKDFLRDYGTSPILVQHAYHLMKYEVVTGRSLLDCEVIFEIGGGYGSFCRLLRNSGFKGLHFIYDLPPVAAVQRLYLALSGFDEVSLSEISYASSGFCLISDKNFEFLFDHLKKDKRRVGFVATWSLSETPEIVRHKLFPRLHDMCANYLIAYQLAWESIDNDKYFDEMTRSRPDLQWYKCDMPRSIEPVSMYLFA